MPAGWDGDQAFVLGGRGALGCPSSQEQHREVDTFLWALTSLERKVQPASACPLQL